MEKPSASSGIRPRNLYDPDSPKPFRLSRSKLELFLDCPRCFYFDRRLGIGRPQGPAFTLNSAIDVLLKKEFDLHRAKGEPHPLMTRHKVEVIPFQHPELSTWRANLKGVQHHHEPTNLLVYGAVDDLWVDRNGKLFVVDYKSTSTEKMITLEDEWKQSYKRQMEVYQWLLRRNGLTVSDTGYFVYVNGKKDRDAFGGRLDCEMQIIPYLGSDGWVEEAIIEAHRCLVSESPPPCPQDCEWCAYTERCHGIREWR